MDRGMEFGSYFSGEQLQEMDMSFSNTTNGFGYDNNQYMPTLGTPAMGNPTVGNPPMENPAMGNSFIGNSAMDSPAIGNPVMGNPALDNSFMGNPAFGNSFIGNSTIDNAAVSNPGLDNSFMSNTAARNFAMGDPTMVTTAMANNNFGYYMPMANMSQAAFVPPARPVDPNTFFPQHQPLQSTNLAFAATGNPNVQQQQQVQQPFNLNLGQQQQQRQQQPASMHARGPSRLPKDESMRPEVLRQRAKEMFFDLHPGSATPAAPATPATPATSEHQTILNTALGDAFQKGVEACQYRLHSNLVGDMLLRKSFFGIKLAALGLEATTELSKQILSWITANCQFSDAIEPKTAADEIRIKYEEQFPNVFVSSSSDEEITSAAEPLTPPLTVPSSTLPLSAVTSSTVRLPALPSSTDPSPAPTASPTRSDNDANPARGNGKPASKGKAKANETFTLTGESVQRCFDDRSLPPSYGCSDGQFRILDDERLDNARERTEMASQPQASVGSGSKRKQQPEATPERPAKKSKTMILGGLILPIPSPKLEGASGQPTGSAVVQQVQQTAAIPKQKARGKKASRGPRAGKKKPQAGTLPLPTGTDHQQPIERTAQETIDLTASDDAIDLTAAPVPAPVPPTGPPVTKRSADDERMAKLLVFDKNMPTSMMMAYLRPDKNSPYSVPRAAAKNGETDVGDLLRDPGHRSRAYEEYDVISAAEAEQRLSADIALLAAHTYKQAEAPQPEPEGPAAKAEAKTDHLFGEPVKEAQGEEGTGLWTDFDAEMDKLLD